MIGTVQFLSGPLPSSKNFFQAGTLLSVVYDNKVVYQTYMGRRQVPLDEKVQQAIVLVLDAVANASIDSRSPDLAGDEW